MSDEARSATIIYVRGLPGSGKTHLARALAKALPSSEVVMLDPDATDYDSPEYLAHVKAMQADGVDEKLFAYRYLRAQAYQGLEDGKTVIWNQPFTNLDIFNKMVGRMRDHASQHNVELRILVVEVQTDPAVAKARVEDRTSRGGHGPSDDTFARFVRDYTSFAPEGYETVTINGDADTTQSVAVIQQALAG